MSDGITRLAISYAGAPYLDRMAALQWGVVRPEGVDLNYLVMHDVGELFRRVAQHAEFDAAEMSMSTYIALIAGGDDRYVAIPVFPSRAFRHSQVYVHAEAGIESPEDLTGRLVGVPEYQMTAALWIRAFLQHDYGVHPSAVSWRTGGLDHPSYAARHHIDLPPDVELVQIAHGETLEGMLESGELAALATAHAPHPFRRGSTRIRRLFPNYRAIEEDYYQRTRHFPIMHTVVVRRSLYERHPWILVSLLDAFEESKGRGYERLVDLDTLSVAHPWIASEMDGVVEVFGGDPFRYGWDANRSIVEVMAEYSFEQGLSKRKVEPEELFPPEARSWTPGVDRLADLVH